MAFDSRHEIWSWDGIMGESLIFCTKDFKNPEKRSFEYRRKIH